MCVLSLSHSFGENSSWIVFLEEETNVKTITLLQVLAEFDKSKVRIPSPSHSVLSLSLSAKFISQTKASCFWAPAQLHIASIRRYSIRSGPAPLLLPSCTDLHQLTYTITCHTCQSCLGCRPNLSPVPPLMKLFFPLCGSRREVEYKYWMNAAEYQTELSFAEWLVHLGFDRISGAFYGSRFRRLLTSLQNTSWC